MFEKNKRFGVIRNIYLYLVTAISIVLLIISAVSLINLALKEYVFDVKGWEELQDPQWQCGDDMLFYTYDANGKMVDKYADLTEKGKTQKKQECISNMEKQAELNHTNEIKDQLSWAISMFLVALPLYLYHWGVIKKENKK